MKFEVPHCHTQWNNGPEEYGLGPSEPLKLWLIEQKIVCVEYVETDDSPSRGFITKVLYLDIEDLNQAMLFKLTWL